MRIFEGIGPLRGQFIEGEEEAFRRAMTAIGLRPCGSWEDVDPDFCREYREELLDWFYSGNWLIYEDEAAYDAARREREEWLG